LRADKLQFALAPRCLGFIVIMNIRLPLSIKKALDKYAADDARPASAKLRLSI
jgi:hypothetical protein